MAALRFFFTTNTPNRFYPYTGRNRFFFTTNTPNRFFFNTTKNRFFFSTNSPNRFFFTTLPPQRTTELELMPFVTLATDCSTVVITDVTGTYPVTEGGYNPEPDANIPLRAKRSQVQLWIVFRYYDAEGNVVLIFPDTQNNVTPSFTYIFDTALGDAIIEVVMIGAPIAEDWNDWKGNESLVEYAEALWFVGYKAVQKLCSVNDCVFNAEYRFVKGLICENCNNIEETVEKDEALLLIQSNLAEGNYTQAAIQLQALKDLCAEEGCNDCC